MSDEAPARLYTAEEVAKALSVVVDVTLDRVEAALSEQTYGQSIKRGEDNNPKIKMVVDWKDVRKAIESLREKPEDEK